MKLKSWSDRRPFTQLVIFFFYVTAFESIHINTGNSSLFNLIVKINGLFASINMSALLFVTVSHISISLWMLMLFCLHNGLHNLRKFCRDLYTLKCCKCPTQSHFMFIYYTESCSENILTKQVYCVGNFGHINVF